VGIFIMVGTKKDIFDVLQKNVSHLRLLGVRRIGLFGSFVRGEQHRGSDIDFLVEFETSKKTFDNFMKLSMFLEEVLQHKVELVTPESLSPYLGPHILREVEDAALVA
jgi:predicted nucleotidyltransferase